MEMIEFCKQNEIDIIGVYENFYRKKYSQFKTYYDKTKEKNLDGITYNVSVKVSSSY